MNDYWKLAWQESEDRVIELRKQLETLQYKFEELKKDFCIDYRMKCDREVKTLQEQLEAAYAKGYSDATKSIAAAVIRNLS